MKRFMSIAFLTIVLALVVNLVSAQEVVPEDQVSKEETVQLKEAAVGLAKEHEVSKESMEEVLSLFIRSDKASKISLNAQEPEKAEYYQLRSNFFKDFGSVVLVLNIVLSEMKGIKTELDEERKSGDSNWVSPELSKKINLTSSKAVKASLMTMEANVSLVKMASWETVHAEGTYSSRVATFKKSMDKIQAAVSLAGKIIEPFGHAVMLTELENFKL